MELRVLRRAYRRKRDREGDTAEDRERFLQASKAAIRQCKLNVRASRYGLVDWLWEVSNRFGPAVLGVWDDRRRVRSEIHDRVVRWRYEGMFREPFVNLGESEDEEYENHLDFYLKVMETGRVFY
jgi:hypothetical protein